MTDENAGRHIQDTVIGVKFFYRRATAGGVSLAENLLEVSVQQFIDPVVRHSVSPYFIALFEAWASLSEVEESAKV